MMKRILLSTIAIATMASAGGLDNTTTYVTSDNANAEIEALKAQMATMMNKIEELEKSKASQKTTAPKHKATTVKSHVPVLKFSGTHYLGFVASKNEDGVHSDQFETRRNYLQVKAYMEEGSKDYMRITLDTYDDAVGQTGVRLKYAYLYLDNVLPNTGVEFGQAHRPWIDYEEHNSWNYRSISKVLVEAKQGAHLTNSADRGINFKTKTPYISSELGVFNGEGYHNAQVKNDFSGEWRLTGHLLGTGKEKAKPSKTYANLSFFGQQNKGYKGAEDLNWMGLHAVYNQPEFLVAAQYVDVPDGTIDQKGKGYSVNGEYRFAKDWNALARYDLFDMDDNSGKRKRTLAGISYKYNKNVEFIANYLKEDGSKLTNAQKQDAGMLTAQVEW